MIQYAQEKLAVDKGLDGHRHHQSCTVIATSTSRFSLSRDHFTSEYYVIACVDHTYWYFRRIVESAKYETSNGPTTDSKGCAGGVDTEMCLSCPYLQMVSPVTDVYTVTN